MITTDEFCKKTYGEKLYKLSFNAHMGCPNRDGLVGDRGCIFCSEGGSGEFATDITGDIEKDFENAKRQVSSKFKGNRYIAYFQPYTNTYAPVEKLRALYTKVIARDEVAVLSIATRPDCLDEEKYALLAELNRIKPVWVELGLQTVKESSVRYIRRGYDNEVYAEAIKRLNELGIHTITHIILYLPGESIKDMQDTVRYVADNKSAGVKFSLLYVLEGTDIEKDFGSFVLPGMDEYIETLKKCLEILPDDTVVHRLCSDPPKKGLIAPKWATDKKKVLNALRTIKEPLQVYFVYIIECVDGTLYTGIAKDCEKRFKEHSTRKGAKYTRSHKPLRIVYKEPVCGKGRALRREYEIKQLSRNEKILLCKKGKTQNGQNNNCDGNS